MWVKMKSIDDLSIGDKVRVKCKDGKVREGEITDRSVLSLWVCYKNEIGWIYDDEDYDMCSLYVDAIISDCEVWK